MDTIRRDRKMPSYALFLFTSLVTVIAAALCRIHFNSMRGLLSLAARDNEIRVEYLGASVRWVNGINFVIAAVLGGVGGALSALSLGHIDPDFAFWTTSGEFVFLAILSGYVSVTAVFVAAILLELVRSFSSQYFPNTWQGALGVFLLLIILFLPRRARLAGAALAAERRQTWPGRPRKTRMTALLETIGLQKAFGAVVAASDISVAVQRGEKLGLIGNNGAGKTTFVNIVTGHLKPDAGRVMLDGKDITGLAPRQVRRDGVSRSFQIPQLFTSLTLEQNLLMALAILREGGLVVVAAGALGPPERPSSMTFLAASAWRPYREQTIAVLPGGVRKLVDVAMAVTHQPKLLLLDEPTSGVAVEEKFPLMDVIMHAIEGTETTVLFVEHDMDIVGRYAGRVLAFYAGRIIADGEPAAVLSNEEVQRYVTGGAP